MTRTARHPRPPRQRVKAGVKAWSFKWDGASRVIPEAFRTRRDVLEYYWDHGIPVPVLITELPKVKR